jgi:HD-GYP domain-containing protein (c-di-GMP phosphodiesterase class II)
MMAIADIFEALTAADRPYKRPMKVSQALSIMESFKSGGHIDPDLYEIFVKHGVHQRYGKQFLKPEQLDC